MTDPTPKHYNFIFEGVKLDPYRILDVYGISHPAQQHAIKKLLRAGEGHKTLEDDIKEVISALERWLEMLSTRKIKTTRLDDGTKIETNKETKQIALRRLRCVNNSIDCSLWDCFQCFQYKEIYDDIL